MFFGSWDIVLLIVIILGVIIAGFYFLNKWASKKMGTQQEMIDKNKQTTTLYIIDKKRDHAKNVNLPKMVMDNLPRMYRYMKMYFVQAKIGPQIMTFMCEKKIYNVLPVKKNVKVDIAGIYIISVKGVKTEYEKKQMQKQKLQQEKAEAKRTKEAAKEAAKAAKKK